MTVANGTGLPSRPEIAAADASPASLSAPLWLRVALPAAVFVFASLARTWQISSHFAMLGDQIRDWSIALGPIRSLPLVGPATHFGGYTIGPAGYWILYAIRVVVGPFFDNLPHGGGVGQALLLSGADAFLVTAVWKRTGSASLALTAVILLATAPFDLALSAALWTPVIGSLLARAATAMILLDWQRRSLLHVAVIAAVAWSAVHAYTGVIFATLGVFAGLLVDPCVRRDWRAAWRRGLVIAGVVGALQIPYLVHQIAGRFTQPAMAAVTGSLGRILGGDEPLRLAQSAAFYAHALDTIQISPGRQGVAVWVLLGCATVLAVRYRRDPALLAVTLLPQLAAVAGYALWLGDLQEYYYLSLMPAAVLTILLGATALVPRRAARAVGVVLLAGAVAIVPARLQYASTLPNLPSYGVLVAASRRIVRLNQPMRSIEPQFELPATTDPEFIFRILGGRIDRHAEWRARIEADGRVTYVK
jgi:hypothetical protein